MSFIDSEKFSPIQSVDEEIDDPSLEAQQAKQVFDGEDEEHIFEFHPSDHIEYQKDKLLSDFYDQPLLTKLPSQIMESNGCDFVMSFEKLIDEIDGKGPSRKSDQPREKEEMSQRKAKGRSDKRQTSSRISKNTGKNQTSSQKVLSNTKTQPSVGGTPKKKKSPGKKNLKSGLKVNMQGDQ